MNFPDLRQKLEQAILNPLPGQDAQYRLAPLKRERQNLDLLDKTKVKKAAVAALFFEDGPNSRIVLTLRQQYRGVHSGQISFPGGKIESSDKSYLETALRETQEEVGIQAHNIEILGELSPIYVNPSNFYVTPYIGFLKNKPSFIKQEKEVKTILTPKFSDFLKPENMVEQNIKVGNYSLIAPAFNVDGHIIWGATAMMISEIREMII